MPIKAATKSLAASNEDGCEQTMKTNIDSLRATFNRTLNRIKNIVKGDGIAAVAAAIPVYQDGHEPKRAYRVLLDSGSDSNLIFCKIR